MRCLIVVNCLIVGDNQSLPVGSYSLTLVWWPPGLTCCFNSLTQMGSMKDTFRLVYSGLQLGLTCCFYSLILMSSINKRPMGHIAHLS